MATAIRPDEVTDVLRRELGGFEAESEEYETGTVLQAGDGIATIYGLSNVQAGELVEFPDSGVEGMVLNLEEDSVGVVLFGEVDAVKEGDEARRSGRIASIDVNENMLGRVIDPLGNPLDGQGPTVSFQASHDREEIARIVRVAGPQLQPCPGQQARQ